MTPYRVSILGHVEDEIRILPPDLRRGVREAIRALGADPVRGDPLRWELKGYRKFRVRRFRIVYFIDRAARSIGVVAVGHRRSVYEELAASLGRRSRG